MSSQNLAQPSPNWAEQLLSFLQRFRRSRFQRHQLWQGHAVASGDAFGAPDVGGAILKWNRRRSVQTWRLGGSQRDIKRSSHRFCNRPPKPLIQSWENVRGWFLKSWGDPQVTIWVSIPKGVNFFKWVCLKMGYIPNYSHLIGIMIINHWV